MKSILLLLALVTYVYADGTVFIKFKEFENLKNEDAYGRCCDGTPCYDDPCDHQFTICIDDVYSDNSTFNCTYAKYSLHSIDDLSTILFYDTMGGIDNPIQLKFIGSIPAFSLKVEVSDADFWIFSTLVDFLRYDFYPGESSVSTTLSSRTSLYIDVTVECDPHSYGPKCYECYDTERYTCLESGGISCLPGWSGVDCDIPSLPETTTVAQKLKARDCDDLAKQGYVLSGVYQIEPEDNVYTNVWCNFDGNGGGWTVIQRRVNGDVDFDRTWYYYKYPFGSPYHGENFWLGLENMHILTTNKDYKVQIEMTLANGKNRYANYDAFIIGREDEDYMLLVDGYSGNAGDALSRFSGLPFSTRDRDNDLHPNQSCAKRYQSGWWFKRCSNVNLNGPYIEMESFGDRNCRDKRCIRWDTSRTLRGYSLQYVQIMIKPVNS